MAALSEKQKTRQESVKKPSTLELHISTRAFVVLVSLLLLPHVVLIIFAVTRRSFGPDEAVARMMNILEGGKGGTGSGKNSALLNVADKASSCTPGPWGNLEYVRMSIEIPEEYVSAHLHETVLPRWFFKSYTPERVTEVLSQIPFSES